ncbi:MULTISPECIES: hypothetical protein [unclassified Nocardioides]|uniref:hypothetical protein n=1 Tax=unclassified Nocardioides TaxID=2615069 RepID=UPI0009F0D27F|nr:MULTISPECIES: hypothetical protein [unclassified Nocardioides]GAW48853.1 uncharacterized protein PD653B2_1168 [Nocardioides sp. PD653-B2]GAW54490.1 uncharacterized protein PD653_1898 [Nocardioides sp. PD653]
MSEKPALLAAALGWTIAVYFTIAGAILRHDPPSPAELSIGNGFWVLAGAFAITAFVMTAVYGEIRAPRPPKEPPPARDDYEDV